MRIAFAGNPGAGKTTSAIFLQRLLPGSAIVSVAHPLTYLQGEFFKILGLPLPGLTGQQDVLLLTSIRDLLQERNSEILKSVFLETLSSLGERHVINDDYRRALLPTIRACGFRCVYVRGSHLASRRDYSRGEAATSHDEVCDPSECDYVIDNSGSMEDLLAQLRLMLGALREEQHGT